MEEVLGGEVIVTSNFLVNLFLGVEILNLLVSLEVIFHVVNLSSSIDPLVGVRGVPVHVSESIWGSSVSHEEHNLMN